jgi:hypothetical protein
VAIGQRRRVRDHHFHPLDGQDGSNSAEALAGSSVTALEVGLECRPGPLVTPPPPTRSHLGLTTTDLEDAI